VLGTAASCGHGNDGSAQYLTREDLLDPTTCQSCHADHFREWSGSMHAYASDDPVFVAMNARGQRETGGALGNFCVNCHAPMAVREQMTSDGLNLAQVPRKLKGVTCFFCHAVDSVTGVHNDPLQLANDIAMRGPFGNSVQNTAHPSRYSKLHDRDQAASAQLCGACHDIVTGHGAAIERTYEEWQATVFSQPLGGSTCGQCHMYQSRDPVPIAQAPGVFPRSYHAHDFPGVDLALTPFPESDALKRRVQAFLNTAIQSALCVGEGTAGIHVILENVGAGHSWPSGAAQDRRAWVEVIAYSAGNVVYQSGVVPDGTAPTNTNDPDLWLLRDCMLDDQNNPVPMFWQAANPSESYLLPGQITFNQTDPAYYRTHLFQPFPRKTLLTVAPDRVTMRVRLQPVGLDVIDDLAASAPADAEGGPGDLSSVRTAIPTFDIGTAPLVEWTPATGKPGYDVGVQRFTCVTSTGLNFQADKVPVPPHVHCQP
jgi:hypothetical protein